MTPTPPAEVDVARSAPPLETWNGQQLHGENAELVSIAISLKRIADALTGNGVEALLDKIANHPMNAYGEGFSSALQEALVRGQNGVSIYDRR